MRQGIEAELDPDQPSRRQRAAEKPVDSEWVLSEVRDFVALAHPGAYLAGDRRVSPRERTRWRFTFQRFAPDAQAALRGDGVDAGAAAVEQLIDLACELRDYEYFHSDDPVEAARFVVSDAAAPLWERLHDQYGFVAFAERAAPQLIRWESRYGWTRSRYGRIGEKETPLAHVLAHMLRVPDAWTGFADRYLDALQIARGTATSPNRTRRPSGWNRDQRTPALAEWHLLLLEKLADSEAEDRLDRLARHPALGGPELGFLQAQLAHRRGDVDGARSLVTNSLQKLSGHRDFLAFATEIGAPLPPIARKIVNERSP